MIDLETMGLAANAAIVSIGVVHFDQESILNEFYTPVSLQSCLDHGLTTTQSTVDWWQKQSVEARMAWQTTDAPSLTDALTKLSDFLRQCGPDPAPWGNGADFDLTILKSAYEALSADPPWKYWRHHCFRTVKNLFPLPMVPRTGVHHNALDDARTQTEHLHRILRTYKLTLP